MADEQKQFSGKPADIAEGVETQLPKQFHEAFARVVQAGMKVMFSKETHEDISELLSQNDADLGEMLGTQIASLMILLFKKSNKTMPNEVVIPAGTYLLAQGADFLEKVTGEEMPPEMIAQAMQVMIESLMSAAGVEPQKFYSVTDQALAKYQGAK